MGMVSPCHSQERDFFQFLLEARPTSFSAYICPSNEVAAACFHLDAEWGGTARTRIGTRPGLAHDYSISQYGTVYRMFTGTGMKEEKVALCTRALCLNLW